MSKAAELAALIGSGQAQGNKNFIINGDFQIWQRATAATAASNTYATADRWAFGESTDGAYTSEQSTDTPTGTGFSVKAQVTTADTSLAAAQYSYIYTHLEAQNLQSLQYGTSSAKTLTVSFFVKSNKTGTYTFAIYKQDNTALVIPIEYTINSANTWEKKTITITPTAGSTSLITASGGAMDNNNGLGFQVAFGLAWGSTYHGTNNTWSTNTNYYGTSNQVNWMDSTSNNFYLSQVQLEIGEVATPFEHEDFGTTLAKCQRYFYSVAKGNNLTICNANSYSTTAVYGTIHFPVTMRSNPTSVGVTSGTNYFRFYSAGSATDFDSWSGLNDQTENGCTIYKASLSSLTAGRGGWFITNNASAWIYFSAEL